MSGLRLDLEWRTTLFTVLLFPALIALGFWQLDRADEKSALALQNAQRSEADPLPLKSLLEMAAEDLAYRPVVVSGYYETAATVFLDNQIRDGRYGHDVYAVFRDVPSGEFVLLNRGWVPGDSSRRSLPTISVPAGEQVLTAMVYVPPGEPYLLAEEQFAAAEWPLLVQSAHTPQLRELIAKRFQRALFPAELRLRADQQTGFRRDWPVVNVSPQKHQGYALQWFTMAAALLLLFVLRSSNLIDVLRGKTRSTVD